MRLTSAFAAVLLFFIQGCGSDSSVVPPDDAKARDGSVHDSTFADRSVTDGSVRDATFSDGSVLDGSVLDATVFDGSELDGAVFDSSIPDSSIPDSSIPDSSVSDSSMLDASVPDASVVDPHWTLDSFCRTAIWPSCEWNARCGIVAPTGLDDCLRERIVECTHNVERYHAALAAGRMSVDEEKIKTCYAQMSSLTCSMNHLETPECLAAFVGEAPLGSVCFRADPAGIRNDCGEGYCRLTTTCSGICTAVAGDDQPCNADAPCARTSYCDAATNTCKPRVGEGAACSGGGPLCTAGLVCLGTCVNAKLAGASCSSPAECASQVCVDGTCGDGAGIPHCPSGRRCPQGQVCWSDQCVARAGQNEPCESSYFCQEGLYCSSHQCIPLGTVNAPCTHDVTCQLELFCNEATGLCAAMSTVGGPCNPVRRSGCRAGLYCDAADSRCKVRRADGETCLAHAECRGAQCTPEGICTTGTTICE